jgi:LmbE family N-acetylglucosaminyl deacetylase
MMNWIYLSPHFDDAALSCGGLIWEQVQSGAQVTILTVCAGDPPEGPFSELAKELHDRWGTGEDAVEIRSRENQESCQVLGARVVDLQIPDVIYRRSPIDGSPICKSDADIMSDIQAVEMPLVGVLKNELISNIPQDCEIVSPLALGGHVDHRLVRSAVELLGRPINYYADFPYLVDFDEQQIDAAGPQHHRIYPISQAGLRGWQASIAVHRSQISTFWGSLEQLQAEVHAYWQLNRGIKIWHAT